MNLIDQIVNHLELHDLKGINKCFEKDWLKQNVRKLKNMGLTISYHPGYRISPRGVPYLRPPK